MEPVLFMTFFFSTGYFNLLIRKQCILSLSDVRETGCPFIFCPNNPSFFISWPLMIYPKYYERDALESSSFSHDNYHVSFSRPNDSFDFKEGDFWFSPWVLLSQPRPASLHSFCDPSGLLFFFFLFHFWNEPPASLFNICYLAALFFYLVFFPIFWVKL